MMTSKKDSYMTLAEHHAQLKAQGKWDEYLARHAEQENARDKFWAERLEVEAPLVRALNDAGVEVQSVCDLSGASRPYPAAIPILLEYIRFDYPNHIREDILRGLARPETRTHWQELVSIFEKNTANLSTDIRYLAAFALSAAADDSVIDDVIRLASDKKLGIHRAPLLLALIKSKNPKAKMLLLELRNDADLGKEINKMRRLERMAKSRGRDTQIF